MKRLSLTKTSLLIALSLGLAIPCTYAGGGSKDNSDQAALELYLALTFNRFNRERAEEKPAGEYVPPPVDPGPPPLPP